MFSNGAENARICEAKPPPPGPKFARSGAASMGARKICEFLLPIRSREPGRTFPIAKLGRKVSLVPRMAAILHYALTAAVPIHPGDRRDLPR